MRLPVCARVVLSECCCKDRERERERACARANERERERDCKDGERERGERGRGEILNSVCVCSSCACYVWVSYIHIYICTRMINNTHMPSLSLSQGGNQYQKRIFSYQTRRVSWGEPIPEKNFSLFLNFT